MAVPDNLVGHLESGTALGPTLAKYVAGLFTQIDTGTFTADISVVNLTSTGTFIASNIFRTYNMTFELGEDGDNIITVQDNLTDALAVKITGGNYLMHFVSTNGAEEVEIVPALTPTGGVAAGGGFSASPRCVHTGGEPAIATTSGTNAASNTAGTVYLAECFVPCNMSVTGVAVFNGTAVAGKGKVMLYDSAGARVAMSETATGGTTMSGTTAYQLIPFVGGPIAVVGPATYFIGAIYDTTTHDLRGHTVGSFAAGEDAGNTYETDSTFATVTLPTTFATTTGPIASLY